ncbi:alkaline phosphatase 4 [Lutzomyia longipalpis]|uniref:alkaline phosphatase 4 n=1 Tax=Lutzomyia longipalpis TaxID=7200 RepID=UPI00248347EA|nr:alkaline phosphatase 4 [Lutzomyia longipalpis]XP_055677791.1 alkaline phosphatase 4 [Lutzomyia longipalpis]XP_055677792.1 alkaline phosphatase 4 [Lutzomyia longipalpis]XP_055677793.1 alkaline phosphatase 4 [Lutzomyia longipalpis]
MFAQMLNCSVALNLLFIVLFTTIHARVFPTPPDITEDTDHWLRLSEAHLRRKLAANGHRGEHTLAKNVIIFVGDGMGMPTITAGRIYKGQKKSQYSGEETQLSFDVFPNIGLAKTYNTDKQVPDSAGTATSLFTGSKTRYGYIGVDSTSSYANPNAGKLTSIMDWAQANGKRTGFVTTTRVTHATPAALYAHSPNRDWECDSAVPDVVPSTAFKDIARQLVEEAPGRRMNVIMGGGREMMGVKEKLYDISQIKMNGSFEQLCPRTDGRNLAEEWLEDNLVNSTRTFVKNTGQLLAVDTENVDYLLGLFAQNHIPYNLVREKGASGAPSLAQMTSQAIKILQRKYSKGFVLMVEGGRIDHGHHQNYAHIALEEFVELDAAIETALNLTNPKETLIIVTADHSHAMVFNGYATRGNDILEFGNKAQVEPYETLTYANGPGFLYHRLNKSQEDHGMSQTWKHVETISSTEREDPFYRHLSTFPLGDATHAGEDVPVYATGPGSDLIYGVFEQNYIAHVVGFATCMGPTKHLNEDCHKYKYFFQRGSAPNLIPASTVLSLSLVLVLAAVLNSRY